MHITYGYIFTAATPANYWSHQRFSRTDLGLATFKWWEKITQYVVKKHDSRTGWTQVHTVDGDMTRCRVTELKRGEDYSWHVCAVDESGSHSEPSEPVSYYMDTPQGWAHNLILTTFMSSVFANMIITCKRGSAAYGIKDSRRKTATNSQMVADLRNMSEDH
jgi:hypothetical protein